MATRTPTTRTTPGEFAPSAASGASVSFFELAAAYFACRRNKRNSASALAFEQDLERNLLALHDELVSQAYRPGRSICFVVTHPKPREVWAAAFRDRVVHHLLYDRIAPRWHASFVADTCACIPGRGTLYGALRLEHQVRSATANWARPAVGATVIDQTETNRDLHKLLEVSAHLRFLSIEPMLGPIDIPSELIRSIVGTSQHGARFIDWVICGGESGPHARPMHPDWARSLRDQCKAAGVPFLFKQWGEWLPITQREFEWWHPWYRSNRVARDGQDQAALDESYGRRCTVPELCLRNDGQHVRLNSPNAFLQGTKPEQAFRIGKKAAGRQLDGRTHDGFPA